MTSLDKCVAVKKPEDLSFCLSAYLSHAWAGPAGRGGSEIEGWIKDDLGKAPAGGG